MDINAENWNSDLRRRLDRELAETAAPPLGTLVADAVTNGQKRRNRRHLAVSITAAIATVAVLSAGSVVAATLRQGSPAGASAGATNSPTSALSATPEPSVPLRPTTTVAPTSTPLTVVGPAHKLTTGKAVIALLLTSLPPGGRMTEVEVYALDDAVSGGFVYDDGHGKATVSGGVSDTASDEAAGMQCPAESSPGYVCEHTTRPDGVEIRVLTLGPYGSDCDMAKCSLKDVRVEVKRLDGIYVTTEAFNGPFGRGRSATRADTLLSVDELVALALDPRWGLTMEASFVDAAEQTVPDAG